MSSQTEEVSSYFVPYQTKSLMGYHWFFFLDLCTPDIFHTPSLCLQYHCSFGAKSYHFWLRWFDLVTFRSPSHIHHIMFFRITAEIITHVHFMRTLQLIVRSSLYWEYASGKWWLFFFFTYCLYHCLQCLILSNFHHQWIANAWRHTAKINHAHIYGYSLFCIIRWWPVLCLRSLHGIQFGTPGSYNSTISEVVIVSLVVYLQVISWIFQSVFCDLFL